MPSTIKRDFLTLRDLSPAELASLLVRARELKEGLRSAKAGARSAAAPLAGQSLAMIFRKSSTRTRVSFEVGMAQLGGHAVFLSDSTSQLGRGESVADTARVLSGYVDGVMIRTFEQAEVEGLAEHARVPVINGLTDLVHPCQLLADLQTMTEEFGDDLSDCPVAWIGDGNNMANSWLNAAALAGFELRLACPKGYDPDPAILAWAESRTRITVTRDPSEAARDARVVTTDVWASMGQEDEAAARAAAFEGYCVDETMMESARDEAIFLHCLPAHRGEEVTAGVIDGRWSRVFEEAENRLHAQKALLLFLLGDG